MLSIRDLLYYVYHRVVVLGGKILSSLRIRVDIPAEMGLGQLRG